MAVTVDDVLQVVQRSLDSSDVERTALLLERHWGTLLHTDVPLLVRALATVKGPVVDRHPSLVLISEILQRLTPRARANGDAALAVVLSEIDTVDDPVARVGIGLSAQVAMRRRGMFAEGMRFGDERVETAIELGDPGQTVCGAPTAAVELEAGLIHLLAGELSAAAKHFAAAHHHPSPRVSHAYDAAGKLGLLHALRGDSSLAEIWLDRAGALARSATNWRFSAPQAQGIAAARMLLALDHLDWPAYHEHNSTAAIDYSTENWAYVLYAQARAALLLGNQKVIIQEIRDYRDYLPHLFTPKGFIAVLLGSAESDLLLSCGDVESAELVARGFGNHPLEVAAAARIRLSQGELDRVAVSTAESGWPSHISNRERLDLLLLGLTADLAQQPHTAHRHRLLDRIANELSRESHRTLFALAINDPSTIEQVGRYTDSDAVELLNKIDPPRPFTTIARPTKLTPRETILLQQLATSASIVEIAGELHVTESTIRNHRKSLYRKLGATSRSHAIEIARYSGLIPG
jgi:LuxR family maltose regulon positive regulatory protein